MVLARGFGPAHQHGDDDMKAVWARVYLFYPLAIPVAITMVSMAAAWLSTMFPEYFMWEAEAQRITMSVTAPEFVAGVVAGLAAIFGVFTKFGIKK
jgi:hypothetical protein